jgi:Rrf2 family iron-sulfur cluster assembly transcriptional regulator
MKLSTRSTYGIRALVELALAEGQGPVSAANIAQKQSLSVAYLEQLLHKLKKGGLVRSVRGPRGGYLLGRSAAQISMADVVSLLETNGVIGRDEPVWRNERAMQVAHAVWRCVHERLVDALALVSLRDVCAAVVDAGPGPIEHRYVFHI